VTVDSVVIAASYAHVNRCSAFEIETQGQADLFF